MAAGIPIMTCGNSKPDAIGVHEGMKPEFDVVYSGFSLPETAQEVPQILSGRAPDPSSFHTQIASNRFDRRPVAIVIGGGYADEDYDNLRQRCIEACGSEANLGIAFFRIDKDLTERLAAEGRGPAQKAEGYPAAVTKRLKDKLFEVGVGNGLRQEDAGNLFRF